MHRKPNTPLTVYLDQNKWVDLGRAYHQQPLGARFAITLQRVQSAVKQKTARFPFSNMHVLETMKHGDLSRRRRLAQVMAEISEGWAIAPWEKVTPIEFGMAVPKIFNKPFVIESPVVFGRGIEFAFGEPVRTQDIIDQLDSPIDRNKKLAILFLATIMSSPDESLRKSSIDKYNAAMKAEADQADQIRNLVRKRDKDTRHRAFTARGVIDHLQYRPKELAALLASIGLSFDDFFNLGRDGIEKVYENTPTMDIMMNLRNQRNNQFEKAISANDLNDLSFLSVAIPYCDIVVTENQWVDLAKRKGFDQKYNTVLLRDLAELANHL